VLPAEEAILGCLVLPLVAERADNNRRMRYLLLHMAMLGGVRGVLNCLVRRMCCVLFCALRLVLLCRGMLRQNLLLVYGVLL